MSCREIRDCQLNDETDFFAIRFFDRDTTNLAQPVMLSRVAIEGTGLNAIGIDTTLTTLGLFVNDFDTVTTYFFESDLGLDTLTVSYQSEYFIFFEDCDPAQRFFDFKVIKHTFDSLIVNDTILNRRATDNVQIFLD